RLSVVMYNHPFDMPAYTIALCGKTPNGRLLQPAVWRGLRARLFDPAPARVDGETPYESAPPRSYLHLRIVRFPNVLDLYSPRSRRSALAASSRPLPARGKTPSARSRSSPPRPG